MELKKLPHIEIEVAPLPGKKLPAAVNTLRKLDVKKVGLIAGGTAAVLTVVSVAGRYGIYRGAVAAELKRQLAPLHRKLDQLQAENRRLRAELEQLKKEGYTRVALTSLDVIPGMEYNYDMGVYQNYKDQFKKMTLGTPLMYWQGQEDQADDVAETIKAMATQFPKQGKQDAILIMAHGTPQVSNAYYSVIQAKLDEMGYKNVYIYTVEGWPSLDTVLPKLKKNGIKHVTLMPIMMVAGDHANNDMAGSEPDSHKSILEKAGYKVDAYIHGIGENAAIRDLYAQRAEDAWNALEK